MNGGQTMKKVLTVSLSILLVISMLCCTAFADSRVYWEIKDVLEHPNDHRPVPTEFTKSKDLNDNHYFPMPEDPDTMFSKLQGGKLIADESHFLNPEMTRQEGVPNYGYYETGTVTDGKGFTNVLKIHTTAIPDKYSKFNYRLDFSKLPSFEFEDGDTLLVKYYARMKSGGHWDNGVGTVYTYFTEKTFKKTDNKITYRTIDIKPEWTSCYVYFPNLKHEYTSEGLLFSINAGYYVGEMEIGGFEVYNFGKKYESDAFPVKGEPYKGYEEDAQWRKDANERIEKIRKGDVNITIKDEAGNPVSDTDVNVHMYEHEMSFAAAVNVGNGTSSLQSEAQYGPKVVENFNAIGTEGGFHREMIDEENDMKYAVVDKIIDWAKRNGVAKDIHGHALMFQKKEHHPQMLVYKDIVNDKAALDRSIEEHFKYFAKRFPDVTLWDVSNEEPHRHTTGKTDWFLGYHHGKEIIIDWYKWAKEYMPDSTRLLTDGFRTNAIYDVVQKPYMDWAMENVDFDAIGHQGHTSAAFDPEKVVELLKDLASYGKPIKITEYDTTTLRTDPDMQGNITRDALIAYFAEEKVDFIQLWGFREGSSGAQNRVMYKSNYTLKPGGIVYQDLVYNKWWTKETVKTNSEGKCSLRAYYGDYDISFNYNGETKLVSIPLYKGNKNDVEITVKNDGSLFVKLIKNDNAFEIITTLKDDAKNTAMVIMEMKDGKLLGVGASSGTTIINRKKFTIADYERKDASSTLYTLMCDGEYQKSEIR